MLAHLDWTIILCALEILVAHLTLGLGLLILFVVVIFFLLLFTARVAELVNPTTKSHQLSSVHFNQNSLAFTYC